MWGSRPKTAPVRSVRAAHSGKRCTGPGVARHEKVIGYFYFSSPVSWRYSWLYRLCLAGQLGVIHAVPSRRDHVMCPVVDGPSRSRQRQSSRPPFRNHMGSARACGRLHARPGSRLSSCVLTLEKNACKMRMGKVHEYQLNMFLTLI